MNAEHDERGLGRVLVATDFSDGARVALDRAARLPLAVAASIDLLHVLPEDFDEAVAHRVDAGEERRTEQLRDAAGRALGAAGHEDRDVVVSVVRGKPSVEIARHAQRTRPDLIVVGRHGERRLRDRVIGTTAERVIRNGDVSVLVVSMPAEMGYRQPLVAVDMSDSSRLAMELALRLCGPALERLDVLHVVPPATPTDLSGAGLTRDVEPHRVARENQARSELVEFLGTVKVTGPSRWNIIVETGDPRPVILAQAAARGSDLIAMGTKGRTGLAHVLVGSVAEAVLRRSASDILVARWPRLPPHR